MFCVAILTSAYSLHDTSARCPALGAHCRTYRARCIYQAQTSSGSASQASGVASSCGE